MLLCVKLTVVVKIWRICFDKAWTDGSKNTDLKYQLVLKQRQDFEIHHFEGESCLMTTLQIKSCEPQNETGCIEDTTGFCEREYWLWRSQKYISSFDCSFSFASSWNHDRITMLFYTQSVWFVKLLCVVFTVTFRIIARLFKTQSALRNVKRYFSTPLVFGFCFPIKAACERKVCQKSLTRWFRSAHFMRVSSCPQSPESRLPFWRTKTDFSKHFWISRHQTSKTLHQKAISMTNEICEF